MLQGGRDRLLRTACRQRQPDAEERGSRRERHDEGRQLGHGNADAVDDADRRAAQQRRRQRVDEHVVAAPRHAGDDHAADAHDDADRQVDAAGEDDEPLAERSDHEEDRGDQDRGKLGHRPERRVDELHADDQRQGGGKHERGRLGVGAQPLAATALLRPGRSTCGGGPVFLHQAGLRCAILATSGESWPKKIAAIMINPLKMLV